jgi:hypothetical protein
MLASRAIVSKPIRIGGPAGRSVGGCVLAGGSVLTDSRAGLASLVSPVGAGRGNSAVGVFEGGGAGRAGGLVRAILGD